MLPLLSITSPTVTGVSSLLKSATSCRRPLSNTLKRALRQIGDEAAPLVGDGDRQHDQLRGGHSRS